MMAICHSLEQACIKLSLSLKIDSSSVSPGRKYARADEIGVPFAITIDFLSLTDGKVTIRDRDSLKQIRMPIPQAPGVVHEMCTGKSSWESAYSKYPKFSG